jgi:hypothetical protein
MCLLLIAHECATSIQKRARPDSIVSNFYSTASARRLLQQYLPGADIGWVPGQNPPLLTQLKADLIIT